MSRTGPWSSRRGSTLDKTTTAFDRSVPVLVLKIGRYPLGHGGLGAIRTLGRVGVPVDTITEDRFTPAAVSRYLRNRFVWPTTGREDPDRLIDGLLAIGRRMDRTAILLPTDDEAAILVAEHSRDLKEAFLFPPAAADLPRMLADKFRLFELCRRHGCPTPRAALPSSVDELLRAAEEFGYPVVIKNAKPWQRLRSVALPGTTVVGTAVEMQSLADRWPSMPSVLIQEYLPHEGAEDWMVNLYCDGSSAGSVRFTGVKVRCWPPYAGVATLAYSAPNPRLAEMTADFCRKVGYRGIADVDWRLDRRSGDYQLLDFNPRLGAQFRLFETATGIDVVRALHLGLTGRPSPRSPQVDGRRLRVENLDLPAAASYLRLRSPKATFPHDHTELAWLAPDDPLPAVVAAIRSASPALALVARSARRARRDPTGTAGENQETTPTSATRNELRKRTTLSRKKS